MEYSIGIDIGGTKIAAGIVSQNGEVVYKEVVPTPSMGRGEILAILKELIEKLISEAEKQNLALKGIGIGTAGQVGFYEGVIVSGTPNIKNWNGVRLRENINTYTDLPVFIDNDVNVLTLAEHHFGAAKGYNEVVCLALGTGVGGGVLTGGELIRGTWGGGAELGHMSIDMNGDDCNCGLRGCLETYASGTWIGKRFQQKRRQHGLDDHVTSYDAFRLYHEGDSLAKEVVDMMIRGLAYGIVNLIHLFNPQVIVLGGGVMSDGEWIIELVKEKIKNLGMRSLVQDVKILQSELHNDSGLIGAAIQAWLYEKE